MGLCQGCHAGCCRSFAVPITGADVIRLERETGTTFWDFACRWADEDGKIAANYAPHFRFQDEPQTPFVICLQHVESQLFPGTPKCQYLKEERPEAGSPLGTAHCGMYNGRPAACRVFPTKFDVENELPVIHPVPEYGREEKLPQFKLCPRQWTPEDIDPIEGAKDLVVARYEAKFFHQLAAIWNRRPGPWEIFPDFLRDIYSRRVRLMPEEVEEQAADNDMSEHIVPLPSVREARREAA